MNLSAGVQLNGTCSDAQKTVGWVSTDPSSLGVASTGIETATIAGVAPSSSNVTVIASIEGFTRSRLFNVIAGPLHHIEITPDGGTIGPNSMLPLSVRLLDQDGFPALGSPTAVLLWSSSNMNVATVSQTGVVASVAAGTATITATYSAVGPTFTDVALVTVTPVPLASVTITPQSATIAAGASGTLFTATVRDMNGMVVPPPAGKVSWESLNTARATIGATTGTITGVAAGTVTIRAIADGNTSIVGTAQLDVTSPGGISGTIRHSQTSAFIPGATVELRLGANNTTGTLYATVISGNNGSYTFSDLPSGMYTVVAKLTNFIDGRRSGIDVSSAVLSAQDVVLSPVLAAGETRIVLTWGLKPPDLDSHLTGPSGTARFRICWDKVGSNSTAPFARLDLDDIDGNGPETTTIYQQAAGDYFFYVFNFSATYDDPNAAPLSASGARVQVFRGSAIVGDYTVPSGAGNLWTVFSLNGGTITPRNTIGVTTEIPETGCSTTLPRRVDDGSTSRSEPGKRKRPPVPPE